MKHRECTVAVLMVLAVVLTQSCKSSSGSSERDAGGRGSAGVRSGAAGSDGSTKPEPDAGAAGTGGAAGSSPQSLPLDGADVVIGEEYRLCRVDLDCILVGTSCNGCCGQDAIGRREEATYRREQAAACRDYAGPICDCQPDALGARCVQARCRALRQSESCFSPTQNPNGAFDEGAHGCACEVEGQRVCQAGFQMVCQRAVSSERSSQLEWVTRTPGFACQSITCPATNRRSAVEACLEEYVQCDQRDDGWFCGTQCRAALDCTAFDCEDYEPPSLLDCDSEAGPWEGVCRDAGVRYRIDRSGETRYWDLESGALIAASSRSAAASACGGSDPSVFLG
ncbi:MAG TPA: hypothetical protein VK509_04970, partial [Polyangiales bacterium]|nr:hypothetical protein [Polyangiales bacterium]